MSFSSEEIRQLIAEQETVLRQGGTMLFSQGRYESQRVLGEGGMGITCLVREISAGNLCRPVLLKFVKDSFAPQHLSQFLNEAQLSILFNHPNLGQPNRIASTAPGNTFGQITSTRFPVGDAGSSRQIQLALKLIF